VVVTIRLTNRARRAVPPSVAESDRRLAKYARRRFPDRFSKDCAHRRTSQAVKIKGSAGSARMVASALERSITLDRRAGAAGGAAIPSAASTARTSGSTSACARACRHVLAVRSYHHSFMRLLAIVFPSHRSDDRIVGPDGWRALACRWRPKAGFSPRQSSNLGSPSSRRCVRTGEARAGHPCWLGRARHAP